MKLNTLINLFFWVGLASFFASMLIQSTENTIVLKTSLLGCGALLLIVTACLGIYNWLKSKDQE